SSSSDPDGTMMGGAGRVRLLHESVDRLTAEVRSAKDAWAKNPSDLPADLKPAMDRIAAAMEAGVVQLQRVDQRLAQLARTPLLGALGGGAQVEIDRLVVSAENLIAAVKDLRKLFP